MAGWSLYVHLPGCRRKCPYCDFPIVVSDRWWKDYFSALQVELKYLAEQFLPVEPLQSVYLGGGTPSWTPLPLLDQLIQIICREFPRAENCEWTMEWNPEDATSDRISWLRNTPITRISLGVQSFVDEELRWLGRGHSVPQIYRAVDALRGHTDNLSIDLIAGIPGASVFHWEISLREVIRLEIPHVSVYLLTVEPGTELYTRVQRGEVSLSEELQRELFLLTHSWLTDAGYVHYEVSNYARPGFQSRHNLAYWKCENYLAVGMGAHAGITRDGRRWRRENPSRMKMYLQMVSMLAREYPPWHAVFDPLTDEEFWNEWVLARTRLLVLSEEEIQKTWGEKKKQQVRSVLRSFPDTWIQYDPCRRQWIWLPEGMLYLDTIVAELFVLPETSFREQKRFTEKAEKFSAP